jgi:UPF0042 nucleotide-binding protein
MKVFIVTGMSGAGKSVVLKSLEDSGYEVIDNIPPTLLPALVKNRTPVSPALAIGTDVRSRFFSAEECTSIVASLKQNAGNHVRLLFLDCDDEVLRRRFTETRRRHPLAQDRPVWDGIVTERTLMRPLREAADEILDTSQYSAADLKRHVVSRYSDRKHPITLFLTSFSYRLGLPRESDLVFDVRFLRNPHYEDSLREKTGKQSDVGEYIEQDKGFSDFFHKMTEFILPLLPRYSEEGKSYLTLAIGCTGGKHRSVYVTEKLAGFLRLNGYNVEVRHRDLPE